MAKKTFHIILLLTTILLCCMPISVYAALAEKEPNDSKSAATILPANQTIEGKIEGKLNADGGSTDVDWFKFVIEKNGTSILCFNPSESAEQDDIKDGWEIDLYDNDRNLLREYLSVRTHLRSGKIALKPGTYYIRVRPTNIYAWLPKCKYSLKIQFKENNYWVTDSFSNNTSKRIAPEQKYYGSLYSGADTDLFICPVNKNDSATVTFTVGDSVVQSRIKDGWNIQVLDKNRKPIATHNTKAGIAIPNIETNTGEIRILVSTPSESDYYAPIDCVYSVCVTKKQAPVHKYNVTFVDSLTGSIIKNVEVEAGHSATPPAHLVHEGYNFLKWNRGTDNITANTTVKALYAKKEFTVEFVDSLNDSIIKSQTVKYGQSATLPSPKKHTGYDFVKWNKDHHYVKSNLTIYAIYARKKYTVRFVDGLTNKTIKTQKVLHGNAAIEPACPDHDDYRFKKWDTSFSNITSDKTITAMYVSTVIHVERVVIEGKKSVAINKGKTYKIKASVKPDNATEKDVKYTSTNKNIATVSTKGVIKAKKKGNCEIIVSSVDGNKKAKLKVKVR